MSKTSMSRREFVGIAAAALTAASAGAEPEATPNESAAAEGGAASSRIYGTDAEMAIAADWARSFSEATGNAFTKAKTGLLPRSSRRRFLLFMMGSNPRTCCMDGK